MPSPVAATCLPTGDYGRAIADYNKAIRLDPNKRALRHRGIAYDKKNDYGRAIADYKEAIRLEPTDAYPVLWLYLARTRSGAHNAAAELETNKKKLKPQDWPYPVVQMFLGHRTPETICTTAATPGERCEARFLRRRMVFAARRPSRGHRGAESRGGTLPKRFH